MRPADDSEPAVGPATSRAGAPAAEHEAVSEAPAPPVSPPDAGSDRAPTEPRPTEPRPTEPGPGEPGPARAVPTHIAVRRPEPRRHRREATAAPVSPATPAGPMAAAGPAAVVAGERPAPRPRPRPTPVGPSLAPPPLAPPLRPAVTAGDVAALLLISLGAFVAPVLAPVVGLLLLWRSRGWRRTDKGAVTALLALPIVGALGVVAVSWFLDVWRF